MENYNLQEVAERLRQLRDLLDIDVATMAKATAVSEEEYCEYESGRADFSFNFLYNCAKVLNCDITELITGESARLNSFVITRKGEGMPIIRRSGFNYLHLASNFKSRQAEPFVVIVPFSSIAEGEPIKLSSHEGQEMDFVLEGKLKVNVDGHETVLCEGDSIYYNSEKQHGMVATGGKDVKFLAIVMNK